MLNYAMPLEGDVKGLLLSVERIHLNDAATA